MADTLQFDLVSPERSLASVAATEVQIPGAEGDMTVMAGHAPLITSLRPGILKAIGPQGHLTYAVTGGFAEATGPSLSVLAENAIPVEEATATVFDELVAEARSLAEVALPEDRAAAEKKVSDMIALRAAAGH
ncbi:F0F1 ATP synthase subunit epsilon [Falsirhodobacter halotolerans]|uniref:F0F1 ATP synthase subunit epsilon n=1 Tax=Falsirhodobacter halotolerans TaxID=1146892 RepID=UPI001FD4C0E7|nr:F0F1 ATP synthase subunit epsilon [Falsirhodobacter halotolerans]MCJ8138727.1 F0F1 ATP synthase subunit epsilon [Falsirhodobacter halotolerans]